MENVAPVSRGENAGVENMAPDDRGGKSGSEKTWHHMEGVENAGVSDSN